MIDLEDVILTLPGHAAIVHALVFLVAIGYAQNYYFHLRESSLGGRGEGAEMEKSAALTRNLLGHHKNNAH